MVASAYSESYHNHDIYQSSIDGCQYLSAYNVGIVHKANCTNHVAK